MATTTITSNVTAKRKLSTVGEPARKKQMTTNTGFRSGDPAIRQQLDRISAHPSLTPYRRRVYRTLLSVPHGRWTTYAILAAHLSSSARAVGNAMKTNPFAPEVPCHRVLASDRTIGGYKGSWGNGGSYATEKTKLLRGEGVIFDHKGRAGGEIFCEFRDMSSERMSVSTNERKEEST